MPQSSASAKITSQGQVTIPIAIRRLLQLEAGDVITFVVESSTEVRIEKPPFTIETIRGSVPWKSGVSQDLDEEIATAISEDVRTRYDTEENS